MRRWLLVIAIVVMAAAIVWLTSPLWLPIPTVNEVLREVSLKEGARAKESDRQAEALRKKRLRRFKESCPELENKEICRAHRENLKADAVRIVYGLILPPPEREEAEAKLFPNSNKVAYGGCIVQEQESTCVEYCQSCREAESKWEVQHGQESKAKVAINEGDFQTVSTSEASLNLIKQVEPHYPRLAAQARVRGVVNLQLFVDKTGKVVGVKVRSGHPLLYQAAISAAKQWRYKPFLRSYQPVNVTTDARVSFSLSRG